jgi:IS1 family transposase
MPNSHHAMSPLACKTTHVERFTCTLRRRISRPVRSTLSFSKKRTNHIEAITYFMSHANLITYAP